MSSPPSIATATPMSECRSRRMRSSAHTALAAGTRCSAAAQALMTRSLTESLNAGLPSRSFGAAAFASSRSASSRADLDIGGQIEVRNGLLRQHEPRGDGLAHAVERHFLERDVAVERLDLVGRARAREHRRCRRRGAALRRIAASTSRATMRPCGPDAASAGEVDAGLAREPPRQRRHDGAARQPRRPVIARGRAHLEERIERRRRVWSPASVARPGGSGVHESSTTGLGGG